MNTNKSFFVLLLIGILFISFFYGKVITSPNSVLFNDTGDAIKNYYTYSYHIANDSSYTNFEGMNYPYGENYLYTDCHPVLANVFKFSGDYFPVFITHSIGILNFLLILSILLTFIVLYFLLKEFDINKWLAVLFSIAITILSPQIFRLEGHLALSYSFAIPLSWLLMINAFKSGKNTLYILLFLNTLFWLFIHAYLGVIILFFLMTYFGLKVILDKNKRKEITRYLIIFTAIVLPIILFYSYAKLTDNHIDRTDNPSGFFLYNAELDDVFLPNHPPLKPVYDTLSGNNIKQEWEAWSYVGISTTLLFIVLIFSVFLWRFNKEKRKNIKLLFSNRILNISLLAATLVLLFAMAIPFKQLPQLLELLPILKQFRATGRFTWPFYFVSLVFSTFIFQKIYYKLQNPKRILFILIVASLTIIEGLPYHIEISKRITNTPNLFKHQLLTDNYKEALQLIDKNKYQAIIALPFYHQGSEVFSRTRNDNAVRSSIVFSYHTNLPIVNANLTRVSITESKNIVQLISPDFYTKSIQKDTPNNKPFLIVKVNSELTKNELNLYKKGTSLFKSNDIEILEITYDELFKNNGNLIINEFELKKANLTKRNSFYTSLDSGSFLYFNDYNFTSSKHTFRGEGSFTGDKKGKNTLAQFNPNTFKTEKEYEISMWMYNAEKDALNLWFRFIIEEFDEKNNKWYSTTIFPEYSETIYGDWTLVEGTFKVRDTKNKIYIVSKGKENSKAKLYADDLLIKEKSNMIYRVDSSFLFYNNHQVKY